MTLPDGTNIDADGIAARDELARAYLLPAAVVLYFAATFLFPRARVPEHALLQVAGFKAGSTVAAALLQVGLVAFFVVWLEARDGVCVLKAAGCANSWADRHACIPIYLRTISILFRGVVFGHGAGWLAHNAFVSLRASWAASGARFAAEEAAAREAAQKKDD